jgi:protocatechuate 3,4-dioxygenase alpha subunit
MRFSVHTVGEGRFFFDTIKPGSVPAPDGKAQAPHLLLAVFARGMLRHLCTRIYFDDEKAKCRRSRACAGAV